MQLLATVGPLERVDITDISHVDCVCAGREWAKDQVLSIEVLMHGVDDWTLLVAR